LLKIEGNELEETDLPMLKCEEISDKKNLGHINDDDNIFKRFILISV
jgi:hypothetical protein